MHATSAELNYRRAAVQQSSPAGMMVILYELLVDDLRHAIAAIRSAAIEECSRRLKHAMLVLGILEASLDPENGGAAAASLSAFYGHIRGQLLEAQFRRDPTPLQHQIDLLLDVREAWRTVDARSLAPDVSFSSAPASHPEADSGSLQSVRWSA